MALTPAPRVIDLDEDHGPPAAELLAEALVLVADCVPADEAAADLVVSAAGHRIALLGAVALCAQLVDALPRDEHARDALSLLGSALHWSARVPVSA